jgi:hypothetical protein
MFNAHTVEANGSIWILLVRTNTEVVGSELCPLINFCTVSQNSHTSLRYFTVLVRGEATHSYRRSGGSPEAFVTNTHGHRPPLMIHLNVAPSANKPTGHCVGAHPKDDEELDVVPVQKIK